MLVFLCEDDFETILCGIYDAWCIKAHDQVRLAIKTSYQQMLFCEYQEVKREEEKAAKVIRSVKIKLSEEYFGRLYQIFLSCDEEKADIMYRFLLKGFTYGKRALDMLQDKDIMRAFELTRAVGRESHHILEFLRFDQMQNGVYVAKINSKNQVLPMIAEHFSDRLNPEHFLIYDENRGEAVVHPAGKPWFLMKLSKKEWDTIFLRLKEDQKNQVRKGEDYTLLWKLFVDTIAVEGRINPKLQRQMLPYRYRDYMPEFGGESV